jgi:hypothetical protein
MTSQFNVYYVGLIELGTILYSDLAMTIPIINELLYTFIGYSLETDFNGTIIDMQEFLTFVTPGDGLGG